MKWLWLGSCGLLGGLFALWLSNKPSSATLDLLHPADRPQLSVKPETDRPPTSKVLGPAIEDRLGQILRRNHPSGRGWEELPQGAFEVDLENWVKEIETELGDLSPEQAYAFGAELYQKSDDPFVRYLAMGWITRESGNDDEWILKFSQDPLLMMAYEDLVTDTPEEQLERKLAEAMLNRKIPVFFGDRTLDPNVVNILQLSVGGQRMLHRFEP